jgi:glycosyltransferase involved in cell wall biosynthesis
MRVLIVTTQVPFINAGAERLTDGLRTAVAAAGHEVDVVAIPFRWHPPAAVLDHVLACSLLDLRQFAGDPVERVIGLRFPAYLAGHDTKSLWLLHQHRQAVDMWDNELSDVRADPKGAMVREAVLAADRAALHAVERRFAISGIVARRLRDAVGLEADVLHPPLLDADLFWEEDPEPFLFLPSRITRMKRQTLVIEALARTRQPLRLVLAGRPDSPYEAELLAATIDRCGVGDRVTLLGEVPDEEKRSWYARCAAVPFVPVDEDYGYVCLEAMCAGKPVITCTDSGGPLDFVVDGTTGAVTPPEVDALADAFDRVAGDLGVARDLGRAGRAAFEALDLSWPRTVQALLG